MSITRHGEHFFTTPQPQGFIPDRVVHKDSYNYMRHTQLMSTTSIFTSALLTMGIILVTHQEGFAQDTAENQPTEEQYKLYQRAQQAYEDENYTNAIALLETANTIQPYDLFMYNIARSHYRLGQCIEAKTAYEKAKNLTRLGPSLTVQIREGLEELALTCEGTVTITCKTPQSTTIHVDNQPDIACTLAQPMALKPGMHSLIAKLDTQVETISFEIKGMETTEVSTTLQPLPEQVRFASTTWGKRLSLGGGILIGSALVLDQTLVRSRKSNYISANENSLQTKDILTAKRKLRRSQALTLSTAALGAISLSLGGTLWFRARHQDDTTEVSILTEF